MSTSEHDGTAGQRMLLPCGPIQPWPLHLLARVIDWAVVMAAGAMIVLVFFNVCVHAAGSDVSQTIEACEFLMVWVTFLGGASIVRRSGHMTITEFIDKLGDEARRVADAAVQLLSLAVLGILTWNGVIIVSNNWGNILTVLQIPMSLQYLAMPVGSGAAMIFVVYDLYQIARGRSREARYGTDD